MGTLRWILLVTGVSLAANSTSLSGQVRPQSNPDRWLNREAQRDFDRRGLWYGTPQVRAGDDFLDPFDGRRLDQVRVEPGVREAALVFREPITGQRDEQRFPKDRILADRLRDQVAVHLWEADVA